MSTPVPGASAHRDSNAGTGADINMHHDHAGAGGTTGNAHLARKGHGHVQTPIQIPAARAGTSPSAAPHVRAASITHETPFGSHVFAPISGAPGFMGERYDWDKGYSSGLMREMREGAKDGSVERDRGRESGAAERDSDVDRAEGWGGGVKAKGRRESVARRIRGKIEEKMGAAKKEKVGGQDKENEGVGEFMEKKSGSIELDGRKDATTPVLDVALADTVECLFFFSNWC